ncbi:MAG: Gfo/Idh/MocA family oxidoreductase, partial [candidate division WOR-3 bacterium]
MIRVAIVGCGKVAEQHASQIRRIRSATLVGVCDREGLMATQMQERFGVDLATQNIQELLERARPTVVHITTPPQSHFELAKACLEAGCHVYVEKPFTVHAGEAEALLALASARDRKVTVGHNAQFTLAALRMRRLVASGFLGGPPVHMESYYCYDLGDPSYARALLGDRNHWVRGLPGGLIQNVISHGVAKIAEFLDGEDAEVMAMGFCSPLLRDINETRIVDELRAIIRDERGVTAYL